MFAKSNRTNAVLMVDGKKLHVNKTLLSLHSTHFKKLFQSEGDQLPVDNISYEDFALLISTIQPNPIYPNHFTAEKILELAVRFRIPAATALVENQLVNYSSFSHGKLLLIADKYGLERLLDQQVRKIYTKEVAEELKTCAEFPQLSDNAKAKVADFLLPLFT